MDMGESIDSIIRPAHELAADGERFLPGVMAGDIELEHVHRYKFAAQLSANKTVLDIASGEGYGSAFLSNTARRVIGVDISNDAVESARMKYQRPNLEFLLGSCSKIPLDDATVDVVVSFETIEHHAEHEAMMREIKRVLRPRGLIVISSPDKFEYSEKPAFRNPFHVKELYREEFLALLSAHFKCVRMFGQRVLAGSALLSEDRVQGLLFYGAGIDADPQGLLPAPKYLIALASDKKLPRMKGGLLEGDLAARVPDAETIGSRRVAAILKTISILDSKCLKDRLSSSWYLQRNRDVADRGIDPVAHWIDYGAMEGRLPAHNVEELARELVAEHESALRQTLASKERDFRALADRERAVVEQLRQTLQDIAEERRAHAQLSKQELQALTAQYEEREQRLHLKVEERERELSDSRNEAQARCSALEVNLEVMRSQTRTEIEGHLRMLAERECVFGERLSQQERISREERDTYQKASIQQLQVLSQQYEERERLLHIAIDEKDREYRALQRESISQRREFEALIGQSRLASNYAVQAQVRELAERERTFGEQLSQQQRAASEEREAVRAAADQKLRALSTFHDDRERELRAQMEEQERELYIARGAAEAHLRALADRARAFGEEVLRLQQAANDAAEEQQAVFRRQIQSMDTRHEESERRLRSTIEAKERELLQSKEEARDSERNFREELSRQLLQAASDGKEARHAAEERERDLRETIAEQLRVLHEVKGDAQSRQRELELRIEQTQSSARERVEVQLRALVERERVFAADFANVKALVDEELKLLRSQYLSSVNIISAALEEKPRGRVWRSVVRKLTGDKTALERPSIQAEPRQTHNVNVKISTVEDLLSLEGHDFIKFTYLTLLGRKPDASGYAFYMEQLERSGDKARIVCQISSSREARQNRIELKGLKQFVRRQLWRNVPILRLVTGKADEDSKVIQLRREVEEIDRRVAAIDQEILSRMSQFERNKLPTPSTQIDVLFSSFDDRKYIEAHPDVAASGMNAYEHLVRFGWQEKRRLSGAFEATLKDGAVASGPVGLRHTVRGTNADGRRPLDLIEPSKVADGESAQYKDGIKWSCIMEPVRGDFLGDSYSLTRLMHYLWTSRQDLRKAFDIRQPSGRQSFLEWLAVNGIAEQGLTLAVFPQNLLEELENLGGEIGVTVSQAVEKQRAREHNAPRNQNLEISTQNPLGANLIGYAFGEFGRGEDIRMVARSLSLMQVPFGIIDQDVGLHGSGDVSVADWVINGPRFDTNIFLINADLFPYLPFKLGDDFCVGRRNIGYWAWELSQWPAEFELALDMVDEVWAISEFVADSVKTRARVPVITIPNAVTVPQLGEGFTKLRYGLPEDSFVFFFTFDAASHIDRKNPVAVVRAFNVAFPASETKVHLLLKTMNVEAGVPLWDELQREIAGSTRITLLTDRMSRQEVLGLNLACDAFVSLHRSEGFGRCVAEAMAYGKPVIVTNYSGTRDFAREGTACIVDYRLVPVPAGAYPFCDNQVWAEPDIEHAASLMQRLVHDEVYRREIALAGQKYVLENFSEESIGALYAKRLEEIWASGKAAPAAEKSLLNSEEVLLGNIDSPTAEQCLEASDTVPIEGWMASPEGIDTVKIYVDTTFVADSHYGVLRPDIHTAFPGLPNSGRSGFCYLLNIADLADGNHSFSVVANCRSGISRTWVQPFYKRKSCKYEEWLQKCDELYMAKNPSGIHESDRPLISLVLRLGPMIDRALLRQTLSALAAQRNSNFELICVMVEGAQEEIVADSALSANLTAKCQFLVGKGGMWTSIVERCNGEFVGLVDVGDIFRPWAFSEFGESIQESGRIDLIYADEDCISGIDRNNPTFKPGWSPIFLENYNYIGRPWFASRAAFSSAVSTLAPEVLEIDEHELLKSIGGKDPLVGHVPTVLLSRNNRPAHVRNQAQMPVVIGESSFAKKWPKVSIVIPTRLGDENLISQCFDGLERNTDYPNLEIIVVVNNLRDPTAEARHLGNRSFKVVHWDGAFNWAGINNLGATHASGDLFLFLNDDIEPLQNNWLKILVQTLVHTGAAATGCLLKYPNGTIQHSGVHFVNYGGGARHLFRFCSGDEGRLSWLMNYPREMSAVTGACLLTTRECFDAINGFDEDLPLVGNDTDYCLRLWHNGFSVIFQPAAKLIHHEGVSRQGMSEVKDVERFWKKWAKYLEYGDFFSNPNLDALRDDWTVNPSIERPFTVRRWFFTDQSYSLGISELEDGPSRVSAPAGSHEESLRDRGLRAN